MSSILWWTVVGIFALAMIWALAVDIYLANTKDDSITAYLRSHPWAFWIPALLLWSAMTVLFVHLWLTTRILGQ